ncbi:DoxX family protein [Streptomyces sp. NPDC088747]|uniref:DoxX family protein n=1 Tax=Streptomyces sp. NPDC088747 TaxID=3365886 RepID=UPI003826F9E6
MYVCLHAAVLFLVFLPLSLAKIAAVGFMRRAAAHLGMSPGLYRVIGALEPAGVVGLLLGLASAPVGVLPRPGDPADGRRGRGPPPPWRPARPGPARGRTGLGGSGLRRGGGGRRPTAGNAARTGAKGVLTR